MFLLGFKGLQHFRAAYAPKGKMTQIEKGADNA